MNDGGAAMEMMDMIMNICNIATGGWCVCDEGDEGVGADGGVFVDEGDEGVGAESGVLVGEGDEGGSKGWCVCG